MATEPFRIFIGKHPCDDLPYIVEPSPDPRSPDFDPFRGIEGEDYSGWYVKEAHCPMTDTHDTLYKLTCDDSIALDNDGHLRPGVRDTYGDNGDFAGWVVPVEPMFYVSFGHRPRCECQIDSCLTELRMVPNGD